MDEVSEFHLCLEELESCSARVRKQHDIVKDTLERKRWSDSKSLNESLRIYEALFHAYVRAHEALLAKDTK